MEITRLQHIIAIVIFALLYVGFVCMVGSYCLRRFLKIERIVPTVVAIEEDIESQVPVAQAYIQHSGYSTT